MKAIKLLLIAIILVGAVIGLLYINSGTNQIQEPEFTSEQANEWKAKINELCKDDNWSVTGYEKIETGIHTDNVTSDGELINDDEERTLLKYLFALSSSSLFENADKHFKQKAYSEKSIEKFKNANDYLSDAVDKFGTNSNLTELSKILSEYVQLKRSLGFSSNAKYSKPLKEFSAPSADALKSRITGLKYYKSHFSNNTSINSKVNNLASDRNRAEQKYYENLELLIEKNYNTSGRIEELLDDQIRFNEISTNSIAIDKLTSFVNNPEN